MKHRKDSVLEQVKTRNKSEAVGNQPGYIDACMECMYNNLFPEIYFSLILSPKGNAMFL